ncbi:MAG: helix-turn-helix domain-containing protein [Candidatus Woesearchaeota archaeon]
MVELAKELEEAGLSTKESIVYLALLKKGHIGGGDLAKSLNIDRAHTYNILRNLANKGLVNHIVKDKKTLFQTTSPKDLLNPIHKKEQIIKAIIPELELLEKAKPKSSAVTVRILEGKTGLRIVIRMLLESKAKEILVFGGTGKSYDVLKYEIPHVAKKTKLFKMKGRIITSEKLRGHPFTKLPNLKLRYIKETTPSSTMIFENKVAINVFDEKTVAILIESGPVVESYRKYFEYLWKIAKD